MDPRPPRNSKAAWSDTSPLSSGGGVGVGEDCANSRPLLGPGLPSGLGSFADAGLPIGSAGSISLSLVGREVFL